MNIIQVPSPNYKTGRGNFVPEVIVLHIMAGSLSGTDSWFSNPVSQVSSHFGVGFNGEVHQYVKGEDTAWGNGIVNLPNYKLYKPGVNPNLYTVSIEHEGYDLTAAPENQLKATVELIQFLSKTYNIPIDRDHIIGHYQIDLTRKPNCPSVNKGIIDTIVARAVVQPTQTNQQVVAKIQDLLKQII